MPIRWSALKVSEAMDEVESQITLAEGFISEAKAKATEARKIPNLPTYVDQRLIYLLAKLERINDARGIIEKVRQSIPSQAIEDENARLKHGTTQSLM
jgi:hypothetical protein